MDTRRTGLLLALALTAFAAPVAASGASSSAESDATERGFLRRFTVIRENQLLTSDVESERLLAIERLGAQSGERGLQLLLAASTDAKVVRSARERLLLARVLAPRVRSGEVVDALVRLMNGAGVFEDGAEPGPLERLTRATAALALARSGQERALSALGRALSLSGPGAALAQAALEAHPPRTLDPLIAKHMPRSVGQLRALSALGDSRAIPFLRETVRSGSPEERAEAALALLHLGELETLELARHWLRERGNAVLARTGARILALARAPDAPSVIAALLEKRETLTLGLELALVAPHPSLVRPIAALAAKSPASDVPVLFATLAGVGDDASVAVLEKALEDRARSPVAALALSRIGSERARLALSRARSGPARLWAARALVVRHLLYDDGAAEAFSLCSQLVESTNSAHRSLGAWGLSTLAPERAKALLWSADRAIVVGAARAALSPAIALEAAARLETTKNPELRSALALALLDSKAARRVSTRTLLEALEWGGPAAPLIAKALAERDEAALEPVVDELLNGEEPRLRAHAALGLGANANPHCVGRLETRYRFETDASVRRAIVRALSLRRELGRRRVLSLAAALDPDPTARSEARAALSGAAIRPELLPHQVFWLDLDRTTWSASLSRQFAVRANDLCLPAESDADGGLVLAGLPPGPLSYEVAPARRSGHARRAHRDQSKPGLEEAATKPEGLP
ncbi:MAG TPA: HEAT repeat domain-containing protein [Polyangiaceae bacterium]